MDDRDRPTPDSDRHPEANDERTPDVAAPQPPSAEGSPSDAPDDRRRFLKGLIAGAAAASLAQAGVAHATPGRKLPFHSATGQPSTLAFAHDLATISAIPPAQWSQVETTMEQYLGPLVDTGDFLASSYNITIEGCITISGSA